MTLDRGARNCTPLPHKDGLWDGNRNAVIYTLIRRRGFGKYSRKPPWEAGVGETGLEPVRPYWPRDFKSRASACSATPPLSILHAFALAGLGAVARLNSMGHGSLTRLRPSGFGGLFLPRSTERGRNKIGGGTRTRTGDDGFAIRCLSHLAMPPLHGCSCIAQHVPLERIITRFPVKTHPTRRKDQSSPARGRARRATSP